MRAKSVNQFTFSIEQMFCKGKNDGITIHFASEWKKFFSAGKKNFSYEAIWMEYRWMDGWADYISSKNANISGIKLFENMIPYVDPLFIYIATEKYQFFLFHTNKKRDSKQKVKCAQLYFNKFIAFFYDFAWFCFENRNIQEIKIELGMNGIECFMIHARNDSIQLNIIMHFSVNI